MINLFFPSTDEDGLKKNVRAMGRLSKTEFTAKMQQFGVKLNIFELLSTVKSIEFGLRPSRPSKELRVVKTVMKGLSEPT